jgi:SHAQKYF class myb-like DNA-binding protein
MMISQGAYGAHCKYKGNMGRWNIDEQVNFLKAIRRHGKDWKLVEKHVTTRSGPQIRSHAQKFFKRIQLHCMGDETPIGCLKRTKFSIDVILSGIKENDDKEDLAVNLRDKMREDLPPCDCEEFSTKRSRKSSDYKGTPTNNEINKKQTKCSEFAYFPSCYKMSTTENAILMPEKNLLNKSVCESSPT